MMYFDWSFCLGFTNKKKEENFHISEAGYLKYLVKFSSYRSESETVEKLLLKIDSLLYHDILHLEWKTWFWIWTEHFTQDSASNWSYSPY